MSTCVISFNIESPLAEAWARNRAASLVTNITSEARAAIRLVIEQSFAQGIPTGQAARLIRSVVGLTEQQAGAVMNLREKILNNPGKLIRAGKTKIRVPKGGLSQATLQKRLDQYAQRLLNYRANVIARHESITAANVGQQQMWEQAREAGLLRGDEIRVWIVSPDERLCPICEPLDGAQAGLDEEFDGGFEGPPAHIMCRCTLGLQRPEKFGNKAA